MRKILILLIIGMISCEPKTPTEGPIVSYEKESIKEEVNSKSWSAYTIKEVDVNGFYPKFLPSEDAFIFSTSNYQGLWLYNLKDQSTTELTTARGAGYNPVISNNSILYQVKSKKTSYEKIDLTTKKSIAISDIQKGQSLKAYYSKERNVTIAVVSNDLNAIELFEKGEKIKSISPVGFKNIVNTSLSPNSEQILLEVSGKGGFVVDLKGEIIHELGEIDHPSWINNHEILYSKVKDDGLKTISGEIFIKDLSTQTEIPISSKFEGILENPQASKSGDQVIANTPDGKIIRMIKN